LTVAFSESPRKPGRYRDGSRWRSGTLIKGIGKNRHALMARVVRRRLAHDALGLIHVRVRHGILTSERHDKTIARG
jgi:hypothetical protein